LSSKLSELSYNHIFDSLNCLFIGAVTASACCLAVGDVGGVMGLKGVIYGVGLLLLSMNLIIISLLTVFFISL